MHVSKRFLIRWYLPGVLLLARTPKERSSAFRYQETFADKQVILVVILNAPKKKNNTYMPRLYPALDSGKLGNLSHSRDYENVSCMLFSDLPILTHELAFFLSF